MMREFAAVSLFCGAGGLDMGFHQAGFKTIWANDFDKDACKTHQSWSKATVVCEDISKVDYSTIPVSDVILGGFPCQGFSLSGPRKIDDSRKEGQVAKSKEIANCLGLLAFFLVLKVFISSNSRDGV
jgi:DNA (cytosine-5)-methyltransferase 1